MKSSKPPLHFYPPTTIKENSKFQESLALMTVSLEKGVLKIRWVEPGLYVQDEHHTVYPDLSQICRQIS